MAPPASLPRSRPHRTPRVRYSNDDSDSDDLSDLHPPSSRPSRAVRRVQTYRESSDDDSDIPSESSSTSSHAEMQQRPVLPSRIRPGTRSQTASSRLERPKSRKRPAEPQQVSRLSKGFAGFKGQKLRVSGTRDHPIRKAVKCSKDSAPQPLNQRIPPWQELPYEVLQNIMVFASSPLYEPASVSTSSIKWLCATSALCRSFHDACMSALLYRPPLFPASRAHGLIALLRQGRIKPLADYRSKIKCLDVEVQHLLVKKSGIDLEMLLSNTPLLKEMRLYHNNDDLTSLVWALPSASKSNWSYPSQLFDKLEQQQIVLRCFEWNGRFPSTVDVLETALQAHSRPSLRRLTTLSLLNLSMPEKASDSEISNAQSLLTAALQKLSELRRLTMKSCSLIDVGGAACLPPGLELLELSNCPQLTSDAVEQYLVSCGSSLTTLRLFGNQSMSLNFMTGLKTTCPRLQTLEVDLLYTDATSYRDRDPLFDELLPGGPPTWPETLVTISMDNMRQLGATGAEDFLASLVDSSDKLPYLRKLNIRAILKSASWRDRAQLRKKWLPRLEEVFLNTSEPIDWTKAKKLSSPAAQRQSTRIARSSCLIVSSRSSTDESESGIPSAHHGRCNVVNLVISDQRPAQDQFHEDDFLDDEPSDDDEWRGDQDSQPRSTTYAW